MRHNPSKTLLVDFDGTLAKFTWPLPPAEAWPGAVEAMQRLKAEGFTLVIFTARAWRGWDPEYREKSMRELRQWLDRNKIPWDAITNEKMPALWIIDDRAIRWHGEGQQTWAALTDFIIESQKTDPYGSYGRNIVREALIKEPNDGKDKGAE